ncbi:MAG: Mur ligase family protein [Acutalibacteraceae bacterium]
MSQPLIFSSVIICLAAAMITAVPQLNIFQQNSYFYSRFFDYLKQNVKLSSVMSVLFAAAGAAIAWLSPIFGLVVIAVVCFFRAISALYRSSHAKVRLKFTGRVKRMYATLFILLCGIAAALYWALAPMAALIWMSLALALMPFCVMLANLINAPIEHGIKRWYINDAKKILKNHNKMTVVALTGSYGKTSTKYILSRILSEKFNVTVTPGSFNTPMGVVRTVRENLRSDTEVFIVEMGAKKCGDIREICNIVHADLGIITSIGPQHLNTFGSIENIVKTKFELADDVCGRGGAVYLNCDNEYINARRGEYRFVGYGVDNDGEYAHAENISASRSGLCFDMIIGERRISVQTKLLGRHNVLNILAAAALAVDLGVSDNDIKYAVSALGAVEHRLQMKPFFGGAVLIDDAYNANPEGSLEAMNVIGSFAPMKRIVVTPGLVELGEREYECNKALGCAAALNADEIYLVGEERSKPLYDGVCETDFDRSHVHVVKTFAEALGELKSVCDKNTAVIFENDLPDTYAK